MSMSKTNNLDSLLCMYVTFLSVNADTETKTDVKYFEWRESVLKWYMMVKQKVSNIIYEYT